MTVTKRDAARALVRRGLRVFRIRAGTKGGDGNYIDPDWTRSAFSSVPEVFEAWTAPGGGSADHNIAVLATGLVILDVDVRESGLDGFKALAELDLPQTLRVRTANGGMHIYFDATGERFGQSDFARGVNVRATNGYVVGPGSVLPSGGYEIIEDAPIAKLPDVVRQRLRAAQAERGAPVETLGELDAPISVQRAREWLAASAPYAVQGERGSTAYKVALRLGDFGLSEETARELVHDWHDTHCDPPFELGQLGELDASTAHAYRYRREALGMDNPAAHYEAIEPPTVEDELAGFSARLRVHSLRDASEVAALPKIPWLVRGRLLLGALSEIVSPPGVGKSSLALVWAAALATGRGDIGLRIDPEHVAGPVATLVYNAEDPLDIMQMRMEGIRQFHKIEYGALAGHVHMYSGQSAAPLVAVGKAGPSRNATLAPTRDLELLCAYIKKHNIKAVFLDPLIELHEAEENDNREMSKVMMALRKAAHDTGAAFVLIHHTKKPPQASADGYAGDQNSGRGASAINGAVRVLLTLMGMSEKDAERYGVPPIARHFYVRLDDGKSSYEAMSPNATWLKRHSVPIANGENVGVLAPADDIVSVAERDAPLIFDELACILDPAGAAMPLKTAATQLLERCKMFEGLSPDTVSKRIAESFSAGKIERNGREIAFQAKGRGGELKIRNI